MNIEKHISQLLYRFQCVTVPGFGAFLTETLSARIVTESNTFFPPKKAISFNALLKNNDGLLANHIANTEKISYSEAIAIIDNDVTLWKNQLQNSGKIAIKDIGEITAIEADKLVFKPAENLNFLIDSFGFSSYVSPNVKRVEEVVEEKVKIAEEFKAEEYYVAPKVDVVTEKTKPKVVQIQKRSKTPYLRYAAIFVLGSTIFGGIGYNYWSDKVAAETLIVQKNVQEKVNKKIQEATFSISVPISNVDVVVADAVLKKPYHIISGAFSNEKNAEKEMANLRKKGFEPVRIPKNKSGWFPVAFGSYMTNKEAEQKLIEIQKTQNPEAWILIEEL